MGKSRKSEFLRSLRKLEMTIEHDEGVHRCLLFKNPTTLHQHFRLTTWPGHLCISGDMGTYVFARLRDMFEFFRSEDAPDWSVNAGYWSEKLKASCTRGNNEQRGEVFDEEDFQRRVKELTLRFILEKMRGCGLADPDLKRRRRSLWRDVEEDVIDRAYDDEREAISAAITFSSSEGLRFDDAYEWRCRDYSYQFLWAIHAIAWGVTTYDDVKAIQARAA